MVCWCCLSDKWGDVLCACVFVAAVFCGSWLAPSFDLRHPHAPPKPSNSQTQHSPNYKNTKQKNKNTKKTDDEVVDTMLDLRDAGVDILTLGQYLQPTPAHLPVASFVPPEAFDYWREYGLSDVGFRYVASGPMVRSSYKAGEFFLESMIHGDRGGGGASSGGAGGGSGGGGAASAAH